MSLRDAKKKMSKSEDSDYSRINLKDDKDLINQKIKKAKVLIIGIGGLGCPTLLYLASSGVGNIGIVDFDKVEISNLNRQLIFNKKDIGKSKVIQAKKYIKSTNPKTKIKKSSALSMLGIFLYLKLAIWLSK